MSAVHALAGEVQAEVQRGEGAVRFEQVAAANVLTSPRPAFWMRGRQKAHLLRMTLMAVVRCIGELPKECAEPDGVRCLSQHQSHNDSQCGPDASGGRRVAHREVATAGLRTPSG